MRRIGMQARRDKAGGIFFELQALEPLCFHVEVHRKLERTPNHINAVECDVDFTGCATPWRPVDSVVSLPLVDRRKLLYIILLPDMRINTQPTHWNLPLSTCLAECL